MNVARQKMADTRRNRRSGKYDPRQRSASTRPAKAESEESEEFVSGHNRLEDSRNGSETTRQQDDLITA